MIPEKGNKQEFKQAVLLEVPVIPCVACTRYFVPDLGWKHYQTVCDYCLAEVDRRSIIDRQVVRHVFNVDVGAVTTKMVGLLIDGWRTAMADKRTNCMP